jgi:sigma-E factor negative regulatory protein RseA
MSNERLEELSAWIDGALSAERSPHVAELVANEAKLRDTWGRYHLIGAAMRDEVTAQNDLAFSSRVSAALAEEPTVMAPAPARKAVSRKSPAVWAAAAAVAGLSVVAAQNGWRNFLPVGSVQELAASFGGEIAPLPIATRRWQGEHIGPSPRLSGYLVNHSQVTSNRQLEGIPAYARLVGYEADQ